MRQAVAGQRRPAAVPQERLAVTARPAQEGEEHVLVVALQEHAGRPFVPQPDEPTDDAARRGAAIDVIAEKADGIASPRLEGVEQALHLVHAAVHAADDEGAAGAHPPPRPDFSSTASTTRRSPSSWSSAA